MKKYIYIAAALLTLATTSCDHPETNVIVNPPALQQVASQVSGVITDLQGKPLAGVAVACGTRTAITGADGSYRITGVAAGTQAISASATGYTTARATINMPADVPGLTRIVSWSAALPLHREATVNFVGNTGGEATVTSDASKGNSHGSVKMTVNVPDGSLSEDAAVTNTPIYTVEEAATRAGEMTLLIGSTISCSKPGVTINEPFDLVFDVDNSLSHAEVRKYVDGKWVAIPHTYGAGGAKISVKADAFTSYGIFVPVITQITTSDSPVAFEQSVWNNIYGAYEIFIKSVKYTYLEGAQIITTPTNSLQGLLVEQLARRCGNTVTTLNGEYPVERYFPVGTAFEIGGTQQLHTTTLTSNNTPAAAQNYSPVTISARAYNRNHSGGGSN